MGGAPSESNVLPRAPRVMPQEKPFYFVSVRLHIFTVVTEQVFMSCLALTLPWLMWIVVQDFCNFGSTLPALMLAGCPCLSQHFSVVLCLGFIKFLRLQYRVLGLAF